MESGLESFVSIQSGSLMNIPLLNEEEFGRESLGILEFNDINITFNNDCNCESIGFLDIQNINVTPQSTIKTLNSPLNTAFLYSKSVTNKLPSVSINSADLSFHSESLNNTEISKIYSVQSSKYVSNDFLNDAFHNSRSLLQKFSKVNSEGIITDINFNDELEQHSLPQIQKCLLPIDENNRKCVSEGDTAKIDKTKETNNLSLVNNHEKFEDSVFIEASYVAMKFNHITFNNDEEDELFNIDKTTPPKELDLEEVAEVKIQESSNIFKTIDKIIPPSNNMKLFSDNFSDYKDLRNSYSSINSLSTEPLKLTPKSSYKFPCSSQSLPRKRKTCDFETINNDLGAEKSITRSFSAGQISMNSNLDEVKKILFNLSNFISNDLEDNKQKEESQNLLSNLADILLSKSDESRESSNSASSVENNKEKYEKLETDLITSDKELDKSKNTERRKSLKSIFSSPKISLPSILRRKTEIVQSSQENNNGDTKKLKPKKVESNVKKGPLKAIIPVVSMAKTNSKSQKMFSLTPKRTKSLSSQFLRKKTSTPISDENMKPIAQSTPEQNKSLISSFSRNKNSSSLVRSNNSTKSSVLTDKSSFYNKSKNSNSAPNLSISGDNISKDNLEIKSQSDRFERRHSETELQKQNQTTLKRSLSSAMESKSSSSLLMKMKQNIAKTRHSSFEKNFTSKLNVPRRFLETPITSNSLPIKNKVSKNLKSSCDQKVSPRTSGKNNTSVYY